MRYAKLDVLLGAASRRSRGWFEKPRRGAAIVFIVLKSIEIACDLYRPNNIVIRSNSGSMRGEVAGMAGVTFNAENSTTELDR
jgi:hypothetical protein